MDRKKCRIFIEYLWLNPVDAYGLPKPKVARILAFCRNREWDFLLQGPEKNVEVYGKFIHLSDICLFI